MKIIHLGTALILSSCCFELETHPICPEYLDEEECRLYQLPKATTSGSNNVGAIINDNIWLSNKGRPHPMYGGNEEIRGSYYLSQFTCSAHSYVASNGKCCDREGSFRFYFNMDSVNLNEPVVFDGLKIGFNWEQGAVPDYIQFDNDDLEFDCPSSFNDSIRYFGDIQFTRIDTINRIFSGHFNFQQIFFGSGCSDNLVVRNGVFDVKV